MKKKFLILFMLVMVTGLCGCSDFNWSNEISDKPAQSLEWFEETGVTVKASNGKVYHIMRDPNGWLYYYNSPKGCLEAVRGADGNLTKDISMFDCEE